MKSLDTSAVTAHALGELDPPQERLLRMTYQDPDEVAALEQESEGILEMASLLRSALQKDLPTLTASQRQEVLYKTEMPYPKAPDPSRIRTDADRERRRYQRGPAWTATILTAGAAAALIVLLAQIRTNEPISSGNGNAAANQEDMWDPKAPKFKIHQPAPEQNPEAKDQRKLTAGIPQSIQEIANKPNLPPGQVIPPESNGLADRELPSPAPLNTPAPLVPKSAPTPGPGKSPAPQVAHDAPAHGPDNTATKPEAAPRVPKPGKLPGNKSIAAPKE